MILRYLLAWLLLAAVAIVNGVVRQATYGQVLSELTAHQISTVTGILLTGVIVWFLARRWRLASARQAWIVGLAWLILTIAFEFGFGHYVAGHPWSRLLADYDLSSGRLWLLFLGWITVAPRVFHKLVGSQAHD